MDLQKLLKQYVQKVANSPMPAVQQQANSLQDRIVQLQEDENVVDADVQKEQPAMGQGDQHLELEDIILQRAMPEMQLPDADDSTFGKVSCLQALRKQASKEVTLFSALKTKYGQSHNCRKVAPKA